MSSEDYRPETYLASRTGVSLSGSKVINIGVTFGRLGSSSK